MTLHANFCKAAGKIRHDSSDEATQYERWYYGNGFATSYYCRECRGWHVTSGGRR